MLGDDFMANQVNPYPLRIDKTIMNKFKFIAKENGRSINKEIEIALKNIILDYEKEHGEISISELSKEE